MPKTVRQAALAVWFVFVSGTVALAQTDSPIQVAARPFGLAIADEVEIAGSDSRSVAFQNGVLPSVQNLVNARLTEFNANNHA